MKLTAVLCTALACAASASADYFSEGWKPGQAAPTHLAPPPTFTPGAPAQEGEAATSPFDIQKILTTGPLGSLLAKAGINLTQSLNASAQLAELWDPRIPFVHDDNFDELIVNEELTPEEEAKRMWFMIITTTSGLQQQGGLSKIIDKQFDIAYNETLLANDLPHIKWGRIDYLNVTYLTTKWNIWQGPWLVAATDRGQSLRFFKTTHARLNATVIRNFLTQETWQHTEPWNSAFAPGGKREFVMHYFATAMRTGYDWTIRIPKFVLMIITGAAGSLIMRLMHRAPPAEPEAPPKPTPKPKPAVQAAPSTPTSSPAKKTGSAKKKGGKK